MFTGQPRIPKLFAPIISINRVQSMPSFYGKLSHRSNIFG